MGRSRSHAHGGAPVPDPMRATRISLELTCRPVLASGRRCSPRTGRARRRAGSGCGRRARETAALSPTVSRPPARMSAQRAARKSSCTDMDTNRIWHARVVPAFRAAARRAAVLDAFALHDARSERPERILPENAHLRTGIRRGNDSGGHSTNLAKLCRKAALTSYSRTPRSPRADAATAPTASARPPGDQQLDAQPRASDFRSISSRCAVRARPNSGWLACSRFLPHDGELDASVHPPARRADRARCRQAPRASVERRHVAQHAFQLRVGRQVDRTRGSRSGPGSFAFVGARRDVGAARPQPDCLSNSVHDPSHRIQPCGRTVTCVSRPFCARAARWPARSVARAPGCGAGRSRCGTPPGRATGSRRAARGIRLVGDDRLGHEVLASANEQDAAARSDRSHVGVEPCWRAHGA